MGLDPASLPQSFKGKMEKPYGKNKTLAARLHDSQPQPNAGQALVGASSNEKDSTSGFAVCVTRHACHVLDVDNLAGGAKFCIDALRYQGLIPNDDPSSISIEFRQIKVKAQAHQGTEITIEKQKP